MKCDFSDEDIMYKLETDIYIPITQTKAFTL